MKYKILRVTNTILFIVFISGCSPFEENIQKNNDRMISQLCDRWLNQRITNNQILKEFNMHKIKTMDEVKIVCSDYEYLIKE